MITRQKKYYSAMILFSILATSSVAYLSALGVRSIYRKIFPDVTVLKKYYPVALRKEDHRIIYKLQSKQPKNWVHLKQIPKHVVGAILMAEDGDFFNHPGYSAEGIRSALEHNSKPGVKVKRGGSTITQQVVKNLFLSHEKKMTRKLRELLLALDLERSFSKSKILEIYLNIVEWGPGIYGIQQASLTYFKKPAANLTAHDAAVLAFMLPNPTRYRHSIRDGELSDFASRRVEAILDRMWRTGKLSESDAAERLQNLNQNNNPSEEDLDELPSNL